MKLIFKILACIALVTSFLIGCSKPYDDTGLIDEIGKLENRVAILEDLCKRANTNITLVRGLAQACENNVSVESIQERKDNEGKIIGYLIKLSDGQNISIDCPEDGNSGIDGIDGEDGVVPSIGVSKYEGKDCWTLDGEFIKDSNGNPIPLVLITGEIVDGITPMLKVENGDWYYSIDEGSSWTKIEISVKWGNGNIFSSVTQDDTKVYFNLADGNSFELLKYQTFSLSLSTYKIELNAGESKDVQYTLSSAQSDISVEAFAQGKWKAQVNGDFVKVQAPLAATTGESAQIVVFATASNGLSVYRILTAEVL